MGHIADYIFWSFGIVEFVFSYLKIKSNAHAGAFLGTWLVLHISLLVMNRLNKTDFASFICFDVARNLFIFTAAGVVPCGGRKTSPCTSS